MKKYLILTVGGSCEPLVTSINQFKPDYTVFVCSQLSKEMIEGTGNVCISSAAKKTGLSSPDLPNIPAQTGLAKGTYKTVVLKDGQEDDLDACYKTIFDYMADIRAKDKDAIIAADYTGGTKAMTAAIVLAALTVENVELKLVTGQRNDLTQVVSGTEVLTSVRRQHIDFNRIKSECNKMLEKYEYAGAEDILENFLANTTLDSSLESKVKGWISICRGFDAWDRFDHNKAKQLLAGKIDEKYLHFLGCIVSGTNKKAWETKSGYLLVNDLMANACRRAAQGRYDDAIGRHYRAAELVIQTFLFNKHNIDTSKVPKDKLPKELSHKVNSDGIAKLGLCDAWQLAAYLDADLAEWFKDWKEPLIAAVQLRNQSLFAHGTTPITEDGYNKDVRDGLAAFVNAAMDYLKNRGFLGEIIELPEFPTCLPD